MPNVRSQFVKNASYVTRLDDVADHVAYMTARAFKKLNAGDKKGADFALEEAQAYLLEARQRLAA